MQKNLNEDKEMMIGSILFGKNDKEKIKAMIEVMWKYRLGKKLQKEKYQGELENKGNNIKKT